MDRDREPAKLLLSLGFVVFTAFNLFTSRAAPASPQQFSTLWKHFFHSVEKPRKSFPTCGKTGGWKRAAICGGGGGIRG